MTGGYRREGGKWISKLDFLRVTRTDRNKGNYYGTLPYCILQQESTKGAATTKERVELGEQVTKVLNLDVCSPSLSLSGAVYFQKK